MSAPQELSLPDKLRTRGYWRIIIRPANFDEKHIADYAALFSIVERSSVRFWLRNYPLVVSGSERSHGADWVGQEFEREFLLQVWRLYQSGQFVHFLSLHGDWRDQSQSWPTGVNWLPGRDVYYLDTIFQFVEIFEFAARLAATPAGAPLMQVEINLKNIQGRRLVTDDIRANLSSTLAVFWPPEAFRIPRFLRSERVFGISAPARGGPPVLDDPLFPGHHRETGPEKWQKSS